MCNLSLAIKDSTLVIGIAILVSLILVGLLFVLRNKQLRTVEIICSVLNYCAFIMALYMYLTFIIRFFTNTHSWADVFIIVFQLIFSIVAVFFALFAIIYNIKAKTNNKVLLIINVISIVVLIAMFVSLKIITA